MNCGRPSWNGKADFCSAHCENAVEKRNRGGGLTAGLPLINIGQGVPAPSVPQGVTNANDISPGLPPQPGEIRAHPDMGDVTHEAMSKRLIEVCFEGDASKVNAADLVGHWN